jgi:hypothetical protein
VQAKQEEMLQQMRALVQELTRIQIEYWRSFSTFRDWELWVVLVMLIAPLILLYLFVDRKRIFLLGFFGLNYHVWFQYVNAAGISLGLWEYPYQFVPFLPSFALDASFVPVAFIFLYQWSLNHNKNIYLYAILLSALFAFVLKPILVSVHLFHMFKGINYFHLFVFYILFFILSKLITNLFIWLKKKAGE